MSLTQKQLARRMEISETYLKQLEQGRKKLNEHLKMKLKFLADIDPARWGEHPRYPKIDAFRKFSKKSYAEYQSILENFSPIHQSNLFRDLEIRTKWLMDFARLLLQKRDWAKLMMFDYELNLVLLKVKHWEKSNQNIEAINETR